VRGHVVVLAVGELRHDDARVEAPVADGEQRLTGVPSRGRRQTPARSRAAVGYRRRTA
jgi:hypothetical protein